MRFIITFIYLLGFLTSSICASDRDSACPNITLAPSHLINSVQPNAGMCYAYRDTKTMQYLLDHHEAQASTSVLDSAVQVHRHFLRVKQLFDKHYGLGYAKGGTVLEAGEACQVINNFLENGFCKNELITSQTFDDIYHFILGLEKNFFYIDSRSCDTDDGMKTFKQEISQMMRVNLLSTLANEKKLSKREKAQLESIIIDITSTDKKINYTKLVKKLELITKRKCAPIHRTKLQELQNYYCKEYFFPGSSNAKNYGADNKKILLNELGQMKTTPIMVSIASSALYSNGSKRPAEMSFNQTVGSLNPAPHALILAGSREKAGKCQILMEENYGKSCTERPWIECEKDSEDKYTGRYWVDVDDLSTTLIGISAIHKKISK